MTETPPAAAPPIVHPCEARWQRTPDHEAGLCGRESVYVITGCAFDETIVVTLYACRNSLHRALCMQRAWEDYQTHHVQGRNLPTR